MVLPIKKLKDNDPILRTPAEDVRFPLSGSNRKLIADMFDTVEKANGIGLAAPQVGKSVRIIVINLSHLGMPMFAVINPKVIKASRKKTIMEEGCLSIPGVYGEVERPEVVSISGYDFKGNHVEFEAKGLLSKALQHEIDHTNGVLIVDKIITYTEGKERVEKI